MDTRKHTNNLQKSSVLFLQLGLVLTLFTVYIAFELKTEVRTTTFKKASVDIEEPYEFVSIEDFQIEEQIVKKSKRIAKKQPSPEFKIDDTQTKEDDAPPIVQPTDPVDDNPNILDGLVKVEKSDDFVENVPYTRIQEVPIFPGCEKVKQSKRRACFEKKINKHIQRKFNADLGNQLSLSSGKKKIWVEFMITKTGEIEILASRATHKKLEREGERVVNKLPTMTPGKQNGKEVNVKYRLPIVFNVE